MNTSTNPARPSSPTDPNTSTGPSTSNNPTEPNNPNSPYSPNQSGDPNQSNDPDQPSDPNQPADPADSNLPATLAAPRPRTASHLANPTPGSTHTIVDVYNATARDGLAGTVANQLSAAGWPVDKTGSVAAQSHTTIWYGKGAAEAAVRLAALLGVQAVPLPSARAAAGHVLIHLGADYTPAGGPQSASPSDPAGSGPADPGSSDPANPPNQARIAADDGITCVN